MKFLLRILEIVNDEGLSDGGIVVEDCLILLLNLLKDNKSNQTLFVEGNYVSRLTGFFNVEALTAEEVSWSAQKVCSDGKWKLPNRACQGISSNPSF